MISLHKFWILITSIAFSFHLFADQQNKLDSKYRNCVENECLIKFKQDINRTVIDSLSNQLHFTTIAFYPQGRFYRIRVPSGVELFSYIKKLTQYSGIESAQPDYYIHSTSTSADTAHSCIQWNFGEIRFGGINLSLARENSKNAPSDLTIGLIDGHEYFENFQTSKRALDFVGINFINELQYTQTDNIPSYDNSYNTLISTVISGPQNSVQCNGCTNCSSILPINVIDQNGIGRTSNLIEAILFCINNGVTILNINVRGPDSPLLKNAIQKAHSRGTTIICAAGITTEPQDSIFYPAAYNEYSFAVTAHGYNGAQTLYSRPGDYIDLSAPGEFTCPRNNFDKMTDSSTNKAIHLTAERPGFTTIQGTSVAAAHVTAVSALLMSMGINSSSLIRQALILSSLDKTPEGWDRVTGWGFLDAKKALQVFPRPDHDLHINNLKIPQWCIKGEQLQTIATIKNQGIFDQDMTLTLSDVYTSKVLASTSTSIKAQQSSQFIMEWNTQNETSGPHLLCISALTSGDEDPEDNKFYREIFVTEEKRDVEISGVDCRKSQDENTFSAIVQLWNKGTYAEIVHITVQDSSGMILGQKDIPVCAQCLLQVPVTCTSQKIGSIDSLTITIETADLQDENLLNNKFTCPLFLSSN
jgi:hypothetical protein